MRCKWTYLGIFLIFWFGVLGITGSLSSGFHFTDDHDVIRIQQELSQTTIMDEVRSFGHDLFSSKLRFRPFYILHRRMATALLGSNFFAWSIYTGILAVLTTFFLFVAMRESKYSVVESLVFVGLVLLGPQAAIWWKLGANETLGMILLSLALFFMVRSVFRKRLPVLYNILFILCTLLATWSKESFILMIPALVIWQGGLVYRRNAIEDRKEENHYPLIHSLKRAVKANWVTSLILLGIFIAELGHIYFRVGTTGIGYAGYDGFNISRFIHTLWESIFSLHGWVGVVQLLVIIGLALSIPEEDTSRFKYVLSLYPVLRFFVLAGIIVLPQIALYMKSGITERYLVPAAIGYAFLTAALLRYNRLHFRPSIDPKEKKNRLAEIIVLVIIALILLQQVRVMRYTAIAFTKDGRYTNQWLQSIRSNTRDTEPILVVTHPVKYLEPSVSLHTYLTIAMNRTALLFVPTSLKIKTTGFWKPLNHHLLNEGPSGTITEFPTVLIFPGLERSFLNHAPQWFIPNRYNRYKNKGGYVSYYQRRNQFQQERISTTPYK